MNNSILIARVLMALYLIFGFGMLMNQTYYKQEINKLLLKPTFVLLSGFLAITCGVIIVSVHPNWSDDWTVMITLFGWGILIKGAFFVIAPKQTQKIKYTLSKSQSIAPITILLLVLGLLFGYYGFLN
ncbi:hypothetical protein QVZ41_13035 [Wenyingzhuangia sp. chi5]|uniref:Integral membrane protein (PIN domain superfamily) n=1 Tax=Wenyingzhuangia gilva TaxID=3057677 RepID=A0ABT8VUV7_9FLAO|nr:hypothetical protein [Wenyingzhuangia sp. chi5]MDO3695767.1 hypothetical protein [Wenyingzhuangia sp. chi5]